MARRLRSPDHQVEVRTELAPAMVRGDPVLIERRIGNLLENGVRPNTPADGWVELRTGGGAGTTGRSMWPIRGR